MWNFCLSSYRKEQELRAVQIYCANCLKQISKNVAIVATRYSTEPCNYTDVNLHDILYPKPEDLRSEKDIEKIMDSEFERLGFRQPHLEAGEKTESI